MTGVGTLGLLLLLILHGIDLVRRSRLWQLLEAVAAAGVGVALAVALQELVLQGHLGRVLAAVTKASAAGRTAPVDAVILASVVFFTVSGVRGRPALRVAAAAAVGSAMLSEFLAGQVTALALLATVLLGWAVGLLARVVFGAPSTRPTGAAVAAALTGSGVSITSLELVVNAAGEGRRYTGSGVDGPLEVHVLDRDSFGSAAGQRILRRVRLRGRFARGPSLTLRSATEHEALMSLAVTKAGVPAPELLAVTDVGPFAAALAYRPVAGRPLDTEREDSVSDEQLAATWHVLGLLQRARIAHRGLSAPHLVLLPGQRAGLRDAGAGDIAAADLSLRLDVAQLLSTVALLVGPERAVASGVAVLGSRTLVSALPLLQTVAMTSATRSALRARKGLLREVRERVLRLAGEGEPVEHIELRRVSPRAAVTVVGAGVAAYALLTQLAHLDLRAVISQANWTWALAVLFFTALTITGASLVITGAVNARLRFSRTYLTQLAVAFSGLVAPAAIGNVALNMRYLQRAGVEPAVAGGSVGLAQLAQFCSYIVLLLLSSVLAGTGQHATFTPPPGVVIAVLAAAAVLLLALAVPSGRRFILSRFLPAARSVVPRVVAVFQNPHKVAALFGGALLLDTSFVAALTCATRAFGATPAIPAVAVVYFAGAIIGSAVPTPGGLGGIEAAMSGGLIAIGVPASVAVSSVLLYRLGTYWAPIPLGWLSLNYLQRAAAI